MSTGIRDPNTAEQPTKQPVAEKTGPAPLPQPIPGLEVVGRGIYLKPYRPFALKRVLFDRKDPRPYYSPETNLTYEIPEGYEVNTSPPMPSKQALNQVTIEESFERFQKKFELDASLAVGNAAFSIDASTSEMSQLRSEREAYYAVRSSFVPLWTVYLPDVTQVSVAFDEDVPTPFDHDHRKDYEKFFDRFGTHYVKRAWVGGKAALTFTVEKSSQLSKNEIQAGIKGTYAGAGASVDVKSQEDKAKLLSHSSCTVFGKGGSESGLAALSSLDEAAYNQWLKTVTDNPQTIELEVAGIWTLVKDAEKAQALMTAYREATMFKPVSAVFSLGPEIFFMRGNRYTLYNSETNHTEIPQKIAERWKALAKPGYDRVDAALRGDYMKSATGENLRSKLFLFRRHWVLRLDLETGEIDDGYPKAIADEWPGINFERIDAAFNSGPQDLYFFSGPLYSRFNLAKHTVDPGYPQRTAERWVGVTFDRIDAAFYSGNGKVMFFRDDQHLRYDMLTYRTDPGYPKAIVGSYVEDWKFFD